MSNIIKQAAAITEKQTNKKVKVNTKSNEKEGKYGCKYELVQKNVRPITKIQRFYHGTSEYWYRKVGQSDKFLAYPQTKIIIAELQKWIRKKQDELGRNKSIFWKRAEFETCSFTTKIDEQQLLKLKDRNGS